jgi:hypothetical protein
VSGARTFVQTACGIGLITQNPRPDGRGPRMDRLTAHRVASVTDCGS